MKTQLKNLESLVKKLETQKFAAEEALRKQDATSQLSRENIKIKYDSAQNGKAVAEQRLERQEDSYQKQIAILRQTSEQKLKLVRDEMDTQMATMNGRLTVLSLDCEKLRLQKENAEEKLRDAKEGVEKREQRF